MNESTIRSQPRTLPSGIQERLQAFNIATARFAFFEASDEWTLEDIHLVYADGSELEVYHGDELQAGLCHVLEDATWREHCFESGYFAINVAEGTLERLTDAFIIELNWWQLDEATRQALERANLA